MNPNQKILGVWAKNKGQDNSSISVEALTYTYDVMNRRTGEIRSSGSARTFGYDLTGQLTSVNQSSGNAVFDYDAVGNRTTVTGAPGAGSYTANNLNQYTTAGGVGSLTYDANGNLATGGGWTYTHNGNSRLVSASGSGSASASFGRDGRNRDVKRTINGTTTYLIYDGWNLVAEYDADGVLATRYIHGPKVDEILAKVASSSATYPLADALGSTIAVTDGSGAVLERVFYHDAFGTPSFEDASRTPLTGTSTGTRFLFTGREWLAALNLYDYRNRTYSAELGRFLETDPIGFRARDVNLYRYVSNNPVNLVDPYGLKQCWRRVHMTHYGDLSSDKVGTRDNPLKPGDIAVGHHGKGQFPKKGDKWSLPFGTLVGVYPDGSPSFPGTVSDVGAYDKKHPDKAGPDDWIDIWNPEKSRQNQSDEGWINFDVDDACPCPPGSDQYPNGAPGLGPNPGGLLT